MIRRPPRSTRTDTLFPYTTLFRSYFKEDNLQTPAFTDRVPSLDGLVSVANDLRYGSSAPDTLSLNENGEGIYQFKVGEPEISNGIGRKGFSVSVKIGNQLPILWNNGERSEERSVGKDGVSTCRFWWAPFH